MGAPQLGSGQIFRPKPRRSPDSAEPSRPTKVYAYELMTHSLHGSEAEGYLVKTKEDGNCVWRDELEARGVPFAWESKPQHGTRSIGFQGWWYELPRLGSHVYMEMGFLQLLVKGSSADAR